MSFKIEPKSVFETILLLSLMRKGWDKNNLAQIICSRFWQNFRFFLGRFLHFFSRWCKCGMGRGMFLKNMLKGVLRKCFCGFLTYFPTLQLTCLYFFIPKIQLNQVLISFSSFRIVFLFFIYCSREISIDGKGVDPPYSFQPMVHGCWFKTSDLYTLVDS